MSPLFDQSVFETSQTSENIPASKSNYDLSGIVSRSLDNDEFWDEVAEENGGFIPLHENDLEDIAFVMPPSGGWAHEQT